MDRRRASAIGEECRKSNDRNVVSNGTYSVDLNSEWESTSVGNPDSSIYECYRSFYNYGSTYDTSKFGSAVMYIDIEDVETFTLYIRRDDGADTYEQYVYIGASKLDTGPGTFGRNPRVPSWVYGYSSVQTTSSNLEDYKKITYTNIPSGFHTITILYNQAGQFADGRGYILIPKNQAEKIQISHSLTKGNLSWNERPPLDEIWYTSVNGRVVHPKADTTWGSNIVSNTFVNNKWVMKFSGDITNFGDYDENGAFGHNRNLRQISLPSVSKVLGRSMFCGCRNLEHITLPQYDFRGCELYVFDNCNKLKSMTLPTTFVENGGLGLDFALPSLSTFYGDTTPDGKCCIVDNIFHGLVRSVKGTYTIPNGIQTIKGAALYGCHSLTNIIIPNTVTDIGGSAFGSCTGITTITLPNTITKINYSTFRGCYKLNNIIIPDTVTSIEGDVFSFCTGLTSVTFGRNVGSLGYDCFYDCKNIKTIISKNLVAPTLQSSTFRYMNSGGTLYYPSGSDYSTWLTALNSWVGDHLYLPQNYYDLEITADDVGGRRTNTTIYWTCMSDGIDELSNTSITGIKLSGTTISSEFPQNTSKTSTVEREISFTYNGLTATTTITHGVWVDQRYTVNLNNQWQLSSSITNPNSDLYDGVYQSYANKGVNNSGDVMYVDIEGYETFDIYIRSYGESNFDYVMVSHLDQTITQNTSYSDSTLVKSHTKGNSKSGTAISNYTLVKFDNIDGDKHRISIIYRKDGSYNYGDDRGYVLIPKNQ